MKSEIVFDDNIVICKFIVDHLPNEYGKFVAQCDYGKTNLP